MNEILNTIGRNSKQASLSLAYLDITAKNQALKNVAEALISNFEYILNENAFDVKKAKENGMNKGLIDRLYLTKQRIEQMSDGILQVASLPDPVGEVTKMVKRPNGLMIGEKKVPIGVIGIIYEARPNVTADAFSLCFKAGNSVILKGGSDAINSNIAITNIIKKALLKSNVDENAINLIEDTSRETTTEFMKLNKYVDVLIPRGSASLINATVLNSTIPVIETGTGNCHIYIDEFADLEMAVNIIENAKTQRVGVCNACESLVVHKSIANEVIPKIIKCLKKHDVIMYGDDMACKISGDILPANEEDWGMEYLDYKISIKTVSTIDEAIMHINTYNTGHSESIISKDYDNVNKFLERVDAACVYANASTRFTDGFEFGFGAEIGISTQKLHARGPMGLNALTTTKYIIYGNGQIRK